MSEAVTLALHGTRTHTCAQAFAGCVGASLGRFRTATYEYYACYELIYRHYTHHGRRTGRGCRTLADGELGSVMGSMLLNVHVPTTHTTSLFFCEPIGR